MKREILFRGKRVDNNEWVYGSLIVYSVTKDGKTKKYDIKLQDAYNTNLDSYRVISETVSQFTGLTDKNGVKIFEGDLLQIPGYYCEVKFIDGMFCSVYNHDEDGETLPLNELGVDEFKIIGNIHDA